MRASSDASVAGSTTGKPEESNSLTKAEERYEGAMEWLISKDPSNPQRTRIETYKIKQDEYTKAFERKLKEFHKALETILVDPRYPTLKDREEAYDLWVQENQKTYNNLIQAAYMEWVTIGRKEEVEYYFAIVDNESAMSRVENSKVGVRRREQAPEFHLQYRKRCV